MLEPRLYRIALVPALAALLVLMFSLASPPPPLAQQLPADALFDAMSADARRAAIVRDSPDRRPGTPGDRAAADAVGRAFAARGFAVTLDAFDVEGRKLVNVVARRVGASARQVVLMAPRDAASIPDARGSAADTAALVEAARALEGRAARKTLVLVSVDGSTLGDAGARRFVEGQRDQIDAVVALSSTGTAAGSGPSLQAWSTDAARGSPQLHATAVRSLGLETGTLPSEDGPFAQLARLAAPLGVGSQGPLLASGVDAIRLSGGGELASAPPGPASGGERPDPERYGALGRAALRTLGALDAAQLSDRAPGAYVIVAGQLVPGWAVSMLALALILAPLATGVDALARALRRGERMGAWVAWVVVGALPFAIGLLVAQVLVLAGVAPDVPGAPVAPVAAPLDADAAVALAAAAAAVALTWVLARPWLLKTADARLPEPSAPGAGVAVALVLTGSALVLWALNPFTGLLLAALANAATLSLLSGVRARVGLGLLLAGLAAPVAAAGLYADRLALDPLAGVWYLLVLITGGHVAAPAIALGCLLSGALASGAAVLIARAGPLSPVRAPRAARPARARLGPTRRPARQR